MNCNVGKQKINFTNNQVELDENFSTAVISENFQLFEKYIYFFSAFNNNLRKNCAHPIKERIVKCIVRNFGECHNT